MVFKRVLSFLILFLAMLSAEAKVYNISREETLSILSDFRRSLDKDTVDDAGEVDAKMDVLNQVILETDKYYQGGDYRKFLSTKVSALIDINSKSENRLGLDLREFFLRLQSSIQEDLEPSENPAIFITSFLLMNSVLHPHKGSSNMDAEHAYSNGREWESEKGNDLEHAGHFAALIDTKKSDGETDLRRAEQLDGATMRILSNSISARPMEACSSSPGIIQMDESYSLTDWILQNSRSPY